MQITLLEGGEGESTVVTITDSCAHFITINYFGLSKA